jgi:hypothetical protein
MNVEEVTSAMKSDPDYQRQAEQFVQLMSEEPCAVCEGDDHYGFAHEAI